MLGKSARYYRANKKARDRKAETDKKINARKDQTQKRVESNKKRRQAKARGQDVRGKDWNHGTNSFVSVKANRGAKSGTKGDRNARGGKSL